MALRPVHDAVVAVCRAVVKGMQVAMVRQWEVESATGRCVTTGRLFAEGDEFYAVLFESGETFARRDYSPQAWEGPPDGAFCHFKSRVPIKKKSKKLLVNNEVIVGFFERLAAETEPVRIQFRFVLALILMRKRLLKYQSTTVEDGAEVWSMTLVKDSSEKRVVNPRLTDEQIEVVSQELSTILHSDMGEWAQPGEEEPTDANASLPDDASPPDS